MLDPNVLSHLKNKKNLLAFSAGVDSSALFFLLLDHNIKFDIALVNYGTRTMSDAEEAHAKSLAKTHKLFFHCIKAPQFSAHFEKKARDFRYEFFESLISVEGYDNLLTAHQLGDQLEWLLIRLSKGAGVSELLGLEPITDKTNYRLIRPLLHHTKDELLEYLNKHDHPYFIDESNHDEHYERNKFRNQFSNALLSEYKEGIKRSFDYLRKDKEILESAFETHKVHKLLHIIKLHSQSAKVKAADLTLKKIGYLLSAAQRKEIENEDSLVIGGLWSLSIQDDKLFIAPYVTVDMPKAFKEKCRVAKIPSKIRPYLFQENIDPNIM